jgi:hypothetical protein
VVLDKPVRLTSDNIRERRQRCSVGDRQ